MLTSMRKPVDNDEDLPKCIIIISLRSATGSGASIFKGTWKFPSNKRGALMVLFAPRQIRISKVALDKLLEDRLLEGKYLVTSVFATPAYLMYLSSKCKCDFNSSLSSFTWIPLQLEMPSLWPFVRDLRGWER